MPVRTPSSRLSRPTIRTLHLLAGVMLGALVYAPTTWSDPLRPLAQWVVVPGLVASGLWLWLGSRLRRGAVRTAASSQGPAA